MQIQRVSLYPNKAFHVALRQIFGLGRTTSLEVSEACGISKDLKVKDVKDTYVQKVSDYIEENFVTGDTLRREIRDDILNLLNIKTRRGLRLVAGLPVSGGPTRNNGRNARKLIRLAMYDTSRRRK